jgi:hypothetical protein
MDRTWVRDAEVVSPMMNEWELFYVVVDDLAKRIYGMSRVTTRIDLLVNLTEEDWRKLGRFFRSEYMECAEGKGRDEICTLFRDTRGDTTINLVDSKDQLDLMTLGRRVVQDFSFSTVMVASVEDLILRELRRGDRKALQEGLDMYSYWRNHLDISYMVRTTRQLGIYDRFIKMKKKGDRR